MDKAIQLGAQSMRDLSSRPHTHPETTDARVVARVLSQKEKFPFFGPRKIRQMMLNARLKRVPAASTIGHLLDVHGLVRKRKKRAKVEPQTQPLADCEASNDLSCTEFKGHALVDDRPKCYPLTLMDAHTRFRFACEGLHDPNGACVKEIYERVFEEFGLPRAIRSDNGPPFATRAPAGLSALSVWWLKLGIRHERIDKGKPQQNRRLERFHRTDRRHPLHTKGMDDGVAGD